MRRDKEPVRSEEELDEKPEQKAPENGPLGRAKAPIRYVKFTGQQPGDEGVEYQGDPAPSDESEETEQKIKEPLETPPPPKRKDPPSQASSV